MRIDWDPHKSRSNRRKHSVSFETASLVFEDPNQLSIQDRYEAGEERWQTMGLVNGIVVLIVAHTFSDDGGEEIVRIISARKATARERYRYHEGI
jgi:uncharacterized protein